MTPTDFECCQAYMKWKYWYNSTSKILNSRMVKIRIRWMTKAGMFCVVLFKSLKFFNAAYNCCQLPTVYSKWKRTARAIRRKIAWSRFFRGILYFIFWKYLIQHCFICRPSDSAVSADAGIEPQAIVRTRRVANYGIYWIVCILCILLSLIENVCRLVHAFHYFKLRLKYSCQNCW